MPLPRAPTGMVPLSPAVNDLGFGGSDLASQVRGETEEMRKKRMQQQGLGAAQSPASLALFGGMGGLGY